MHSFTCTFIPALCVRTSKHSGETAPTKCVDGLTDILDLTMQWSLNLRLHKVLYVHHILIKLIL